MLLFLGANAHFGYEEMLRMQTEELAAFVQKQEALLSKIASSMRS